MQTTFTKNDIAALLTSNDMAVVRAIEALYLRQTEDEKASDTTSHRNGRGFNGTDAFILSRFAVQIAEWRAEKVANGRTRFPFPLSTREGGQLALARKKIMKYAGQLADIANDKAGVKAGVKIEVKVELPTVFPDPEINALYHEMMGQAKAQVQNNTDAERDAQKAAKKAARDAKRDAEFAAYHARMDAKQAAIEAELVAEELAAERAAIQAIEAGEVDFDDDNDTFGPAPIEVEDEYLSLV